MSPGAVLTVGAFDGLHRGHQALLREVVARAGAGGMHAGVVTFEPHPASVLKPEGSGPRLTVGAERLELFAEFGVDRLHVVRFDAALAGLGAEEFVRRILLERCGMRELVIGTDHGFGRGRGGDRHSLPELGRMLGFGVTVVAPVQDVSGATISSTRVRTALQEGRLGAVREWLGRPYRCTALVVPGAGRGRTIGLPTINLDGPAPEKALPPDGVYAVRVEWGGGVAGGMMNQGPRPTIGDRRRTLEAHLFGLDRDLYGRMVRVEWVERLRDVRRFASLDELRAQLGQDREHAMAVLARPPETSTARR